MDSSDSTTKATFLKSINSFSWLFYLFRMTGLQGRDEFIFEASADGINYKEIDFFYKPGDLHKAPSFSIPYHLRLEWQIWF